MIWYCSLWTDHSLNQWIGREIIDSVLLLFAGGILQENQEGVYDRRNSEIAVGKDLEEGVEGKVGNWFSKF